MVRLFIDRVEMRAQFIERHTQILRNQARLCGDAHEIRVAAPPRNDVHVIVVGEPCARDLSEVHPDVESVGPVDVGEDPLCLGRHPDERMQRGVIAIEQPRLVRDRCDHEMAVRVRIAVHHHERPRTAEERERLAPIGVARRNAEDAAGRRVGLRSGQVGISPGGEKNLHSRLRGYEVAGFQNLVTPKLRNPHSASATADSAADSTSGMSVPSAIARLISSFNSFPGLKYGIFLDGTSTFSPGFGLRPVRDLRLRRRKLPKPRSSIFWPLRSESTIESNTMLTIVSACFFVSCTTLATSSTSSALVLTPVLLSLSCS